MLFSTLITSVLAAGVALAQDYTINTPAALIQCQPANINWQGGSGPYILAVIPGGQPSAPALVTLADGTEDTTYVWTVSLAEGTSITLRLTDSGGDIVYSSPVTIQAGSSTDCLNATATEAAGAAGVTGGASGSAASGASSTASGASASAASGASSASGAATSAASSASNAVSSVRSQVSSGASSASARVSSATSSGSATPVSSGASASSSAPNAAMANAAPGVFLAALGGLAALL